jgi:hypothetical protein
VTIKEQEQEVHLVCAVGVGGMTLWLDVGRVVVQDVEDEETKWDSCWPHGLCEPVYV